MMPDRGPALEGLRAAVRTLYGAASDERRAADQWLCALQESPEGWAVAEAVLAATPVSSPEELFLAASMLRHKIRAEAQALPQAARAALWRRTLSHVAAHAGGRRNVVTQLLLAAATSARHAAVCPPSGTLVSEAIEACATGGGSAVLNALTILAEEARRPDPAPAGDEQQQQDTPPGSDAYSAELRQCGASALAALHSSTEDNAARLHALAVWLPFLPPAAVAETPLLGAAVQLLQQPGSQQDDEDLCAAAAEALIAAAATACTADAGTAQAVTAALLGSASGFAAAARAAAGTPRGDAAARVVSAVCGSFAPQLLAAVQQGNEAAEGLLSCLTASAGSSDPDCAAAALAAWRPLRIAAEGCPPAIALLRPHALRLVSHCVAAAEWPSAATDEGWFDTNDAAEQTNLRDDRLGPAVCDAAAVVGGVGFAQGMLHQREAWHRAEALVWAMHVASHSVGGEGWAAVGREVATVMLPLSNAGAHPRLRSTVCRCAASSGFLGALGGKHRDGSPLLIPAVSAAAAALLSPVSSRSGAGALRCLCIIAGAELARGGHANALFNVFTQCVTPGQNGAVVRLTRDELFRVAGACAEVAGRLPEEARSAAFAGLSQPLAERAARAAAERDHAACAEALAALGALFKAQQWSAKPSGWRGAWAGAWGVLSQCVAAAPDARVIEEAALFLSGLSYVCWSDCREDLVTVLSELFKWWSQAALAPVLAAARDVVVLSCTDPDRAPVSADFAATLGQHALGVLSAEGFSTPDRASAYFDFMRAAVAREHVGRGQARRNAVFMPLAASGHVDAALSAAKAVAAGTTASLPVLRSTLGFVDSLARNDDAVDWWREGARGHEASGVCMAVLLTKSQDVASFAQRVLGLVIPRSPQGFAAALSDVPQTVLPAAGRDAAVQAAAASDWGAAAGAAAAAIQVRRAQLG
eukprot:TRINITY_DN16937_c0_g1_i1.p1 TRINITY_DN16937_c0_g1~~TRINITY_DN16937_c0_g1_i1.p1  ORF type:complete len:930 (+),score=170.80 TRINITY_DN16937_c0_g1_i1:90-2879(+)